ncbi:histone deacetylase family protein [Telmatospirillum sp. J64-1]|uniref:histone deacetylase family protein n=1 Tax=Telmatospirillum sp. J64-1 TaxID=2502183 RepID=UPI00115C8519|nr:histone deacetylase family protein [Telmatospirillum sp. J64-1]
MPTLLFTHPACLEHDTGPHHPECADRLKAVLAALEGEEFTLLHREEAPHATMEQLLRAHPPHHVDYVLSHLPHGDMVHHLDPDTVVSANSGEAALRAAGAVVAAVDAVARKECRNAFCAVRPPGHHAERDQSMGFCLFNNVAIGALHAREVHGLRRVAVIDFDVHHGNGTQHIFEEDAELFYGSTHQANAFPGTGGIAECGVGGNICNVPLPPGATGAEFRSAMSEKVLPALRAFRPDIILISAGFDAHASDPMAHLRLTTADFSWVTHEILKIADETCNSRVVSVLEGGYDLTALAACTVAHVRALMGS